MKMWIAEIFVYNIEDEYGYITDFFKDNKPFDRKEKALNYIRDFRKILNSKSHTKYWNQQEISVYTNNLIDKCKITEFEINI